MISFRQRNDLSWMGNSLYWPPRWYRNKWGRRAFWILPWIIIAVLKGLKL